VALSILLAIAQSSIAMTREERKTYLDKLIQILPAVPSFNEWLRRTGEMPPDYDTLPKINTLPDPLRFLDGHMVKKATDWKARRAELPCTGAEYDLGTFPPKPKLDNVVVLSEDQRQRTDHADSAAGIRPRRKSQASGNGNHSAGPGPFPVMISPSITAPGAASFGGIALAGVTSLPGSPGNDQQNDANAYVPLYPDFDFADLPRRAWSAQMLVDYLYTLRRSIMTISHSTDIPVTARWLSSPPFIDSRIAAVIPGSTGVGGVMPWRLGSESGFGESIESTTRNFPTWFVPQLRFFSGREDRFPSMATPWLLSLRRAQF
jgi:hypothetical protein